MTEPDLVTIKEKLSNAEDLISKEGPEETPYVHKYEARDKLKEILDLIGDGDHDLPVHIYARLGSVDHDVEELAQSQEDLERALRKAEGRETAGAVVMPVLVCLNQVCVHVINFNYVT